jgi:hypothetical protein
MRDRSSTTARKAPIRPLIKRAEALATAVAALQRRIEKRFPGSALEVSVRRATADVKWAALLLETYKHDQPEAPDLGPRRY